MLHVDAGMARQEFDRRRQLHDRPSGSSCEESRRGCRFAGLTHGMTQEGPRITTGFIKSILFSLHIMVCYKTYLNHDTTAALLKTPGFQRSHAIIHCELVAEQRNR